MFRRSAFLLALGLIGPSIALADDTKPVSKTAATVEWKIDRVTPPETVDELRAMQSLLKTTVEKVTPATVGMFIGQSAGSGVIVSEDGLVLTAAHVIGKPDQPIQFVMPDGQRVFGKSLGLNRGWDSGMAKITGKPPKNAKWPGAADGKWPAVELGKSTDLKAGQYVIALGHPGGYKPDRKPPVRLGQFLRSSRIGQSLTTDCTLVGGDSGGPLFDMAGKLIGIHSRIGFDLESNVHIPIEAFRTDWKDMLSEDRVNQDPPVYFGVKFDYANDTPVVMEVRPDSPADQAGVQVGDRIIRFNKVEVKRANTVYEQLFDLKPGTKVAVELTRGEETIKLEATLAARKTEEKKPRNDQKKDK